ncbi:MAG: hypothetical protein CME26_15725 [Gemmatimonadetes bacterium]|nr:hypothetical protein [Gemmatimonadota bacterium]
MHSWGPGPGISHDDIAPSEDLAVMQDALRTQNFDCLWIWIPAEKFVRPDECADARVTCRLPVDVRVPDHRRHRQIHIVLVRQTEEHPRMGLTIVGLGKGGSPGVRLFPSKA